MGTYPGAWCLAKVFTIFKKGVRSLSSNYRGISILSALCKLYYCVLNRRFTLWYRPDTEQTGAQEGRGCPEQLLLLRLIIDIARKTWNTLYILFVDFEKGYDKVSRQKLLTLLSEQGCGAQFLSAIANILKDTDNIIGSKSFKATAGVCEGGATSCSIFTFYVNAIIRKGKEFGPDGFLYISTPLDAHGWYCHIHNFKKEHGANISITHGNYSSPAYVMSSCKVKVHDCQHKWHRTLYHQWHYYIIHWLICLPRLPNIKSPHTKTKLYHIVHILYTFLLTDIKIYTMCLYITITILLWVLSIYPFIKHYTIVVSIITIQFSHINTFT